VVAAFVLTKAAGMKIHLFIVMVKDVMLPYIKVRFSFSNVKKIFASFKESDDS
jgi:hypothetical protein